MNRILDSYLDAWRNWLNFTGRTRRSGYWYAVLANIIIVFILGILSDIVGIFSWISTLYSLAFLIPSLSLTVRRLHDTGRSAWWLLVIYLVPGVCGLLMGACMAASLGSIIMGGSGGIYFVLMVIFGLLACAAGILALVLMVKDSGPDNQWGPDPKGRSGFHPTIGYGPQYGAPQNGPQYGPQNGPQYGAPQDPGYQYTSPSDAERRENDRGPEL